MKQELQDKLYKKYPKIFAQKDLSIQESCMPWGIECGDGWYWLIDKLCDILQWHVDSDENKNQIEAVQVKEKFGSLCFYVSNTDEHAISIIGFAEQLSNDICEICGSTEDVTQTEGWIKTRCKECLSKGD